MQSQNFKFRRAIEALYVEWNKIVCNFIEVDNFFEKLYILNQEEQTIGSNLFTLYYFL